MMHILVELFFLTLSHVISRVIFVYTMCQSEICPKSMDNKPLLDHGYSNSSFELKEPPVLSKEFVDKHQNLK